MSRTSGDGSEDGDLNVLPAGEMIGERYRIVRLLGQGGMGAVYEAENTWTKRRVAIKVLLPALSGDNRAVARFQGEAQAATQLQHPNIVDVLDMGKDAPTGAVFIVQEFLRGEDLHHYVTKRGRLTPAEAAEVLVPVMGALAVAHERGIIHRDIKPENIFLVGGSKGLTPKLIDFGLAKVLGETASARKTSTGTIMGTPYYMSPEQARGDRVVDARTDIWALGAVFFEMLTGQLPYDAASANLIIVKLLTAAPPMLRDVAPELPEDVAAIVSRAMEPDLDKRYGTMREMLTHVLGAAGFQSTERTATLRERFALSIEHEPPPAAEEESPAPPAEREMGSLATQPVSSPSRATRPIGGSVPSPSIPEAPKESTHQSWQREKLASAAPSKPASSRMLAGVAVVGLLIGGAAVAMRFVGDSSTPTPTPVRAASPVPPPATPTVAPAVPPQAVSPPPQVAAPGTAHVDAGAAGAVESDAAVAPARQPAESPAADQPPGGRRHRRRHRDRDPLAPAEG